VGWLALLEPTNSAPYVSPPSFLPPHPPPPHPHPSHPSCPLSPLSLCPGNWAELELDTRADGKSVRVDKDGKKVKANIWLSYLRSYEVGGLGWDGWSASGAGRGCPAAWSPGSLACYLLLPAPGCLCMGTCMCMHTHS